MSRSPKVGDSSFNSHSDDAQFEEKPPPEFYPTGLAGRGVVNCIKFNSEQDVFAIAILRLRLECKQGRRMINPGSERGVNLGPPEKVVDCHQAIATGQKGDRDSSVPITLILVPICEPSRLSSLNPEQKTDPVRASNL